MPNTDREKQLSSMTWPAKPQAICLHCRIAERRRFSWFCRIECEDAYIESRRKLG